MIKTLVTCRENIGSLVKYAFKNMIVSRVFAIDVICIKTQFRTLIKAV